MPRFARHITKNPGLFATGCDDPADPAGRGGVHGNSKTVVVTCPMTGKTAACDRRRPASGGRTWPPWPPLSAVAAPYAAIVGLGALLWWLSADHPSLLPFWAPWDFSPPEYLLTALALFWFLRGLRLSAPAVRPPLWRRAAFLVGLGLVYAVLQTRFEYWSQHMFFLDSIQHVEMHHIGPFLIALGGAGAMLKRGMPRRLARAIETPTIGALVRVLQQPVLAVFLFSGLFYAFWFIPAVHFRAMLDPRLYALMNWSMALNGILFWCLVLDPRPKPPARLGYGMRMAVACAVMFPQVALGAAITFAPHDLYPFYALCGRLWPSIGARLDQHLGGIVIWDQATMSAVAVVFVLNAMRRHDEARPEETAEAEALAALASRWTGR
jgi:putative membrane protein